MTSHMFFTDWEGPWIVTDFAYELCLAIFNNATFFEKLSRYDDYLAYEVKKEGYEAGDTLKLLIPFLIAAGVKNSEIEKIAENVAVFVPNAKEAIQFLQQKYTPVVISTSYIQYLKKTASMINLKGQLYGTVVDFEKYTLENDEKRDILKAIDKISSLNDSELVPFLNEFFSDLKNKSAGKILDEVKVVNGDMKKKIVVEHVENFGIENILAIGDSISDYKMLDWVKKHGGLAVSFNGNEYALKHSNVAIISDSAISEAILIDLFLRKGFEKLREFEKLDDYPNHIRELFLKSNTKIYFLDEVNYKQILEESINMRRKLRGSAALLG